MEKFNPHKLRPHIIASRNMQQRELRNGTDFTWPILRSTLRDYEYSFIDLFEADDFYPIKHFKERRVEQHKPIVALDLMSEGQALRDLAPNRGLAVALTDQRFPADKASDQGHIDMINGDLLDMKVWTQVQQWIKHNGGPEGKFHLIFGHGVAALSKLPNDPALLYLLVERVYEILSHDDAMMLVQLPPGVDDALDRWTQQLSTIPGLEVANSLKTQRTIKTSFQRLKIVKHPDAPDSLPEIK